jgi:hypothetical protein
MFEVTLGIVKTNSGKFRMIVIWPKSILRNDFADLVQRPDVIRSPLLVHYYITDMLLHFLTTRVSKLRIGSTIAGLVVFVLGLVGLAQMLGYPVVPFSLNLSAYLTDTGAFVLFTFITVVGIGAMASGLATPDEARFSESDLADLRQTASEIRAARRGVPLPVYRAGPALPQDLLSELEVTILWNVSQGRDSVPALSRTTGVDPMIVSRRMGGLRDLGYLTADDKLTERGFDELSLRQPRLVTTSTS